MKEKIDEPVKRSESIHGSETLQNGRNFYSGRFSSEE
jgi:hypothetical protein